MTDYADKSALRRAPSLRRYIRTARLWLLQNDIANCNRVIQRVEDERAQLLADRAVSQDKLRDLLRSA